jgi:hypothetical protein
MEISTVSQPISSLSLSDLRETVGLNRDRSDTGSIDVLVVKQRLWVLIIESKQSRFDVTAGIPQALSYMLSQSAASTTEGDGLAW